MMEPGFDFKAMMAEYGRMRDGYLDAVRDWVANGPASRWALTADQLRERIAVPNPDHARARGVRRGQAPPSRELDLQATGVAPRGGREVGWPGVLGGSESARRPPVLSAPRALSLVK